MLNLNKMSSLKIDFSTNSPFSSVNQLYRLTQKDKCHFTTSWTIQGEVVQYNPVE